MASPGPGASRRDVVPALLAAVAASLARDPAAPRGVVISAPSGAGKSHVLREVRDRLGPPARFAAADPAAVLTPFGVAAVLLDAVESSTARRDALMRRADELIGAQSLVLLVDDLQFVDAESLDVVGELVTLDAPIVLIATRRPDLNRVSVNRLLGLDRLVDWPLPVLDGMDLDVLVREHTGRWPGERLRAVLGATAGNALHVLSVLDSLLDSGAAAGTTMLELAVEATTPVPTLDIAVTAALDRLGGDQLDLVRALCVLGRPAELDEVAGLLARPATSLLDPAQRLLDRQVLRADGERIMFAHDAYREAAYRDIPAPLRRTLHRAAAPGSGPAQRARHLIATDPDSDDLLTAVRGALDELPDAPGVAADLLAEAAQGVPAGAVAAELAVRRARALARSGQLRLAGEIAQAASGWPAQAEVAAELRRVRIFSLSAGGHVDEALALVDATLAGPLPDVARRILTDHRLLLLLLAGSRPVPVQPLDGDVRQLTLNAVVAETMRRCLIGDTGVALEFAWAATRRSLAAPIDPNEGLSADIWTPYVALAHAGADAGRAALHEAIALRQERDEGWQTAAHQAIAGGIELTAGRLDDAAAQLDAALIHSAGTEASGMSQAVAARTLVDVLRGDTRAARQRLDAWLGSEEFGLPQLDRARVAVLEAERQYADSARLALRAWLRAGELNLYGFQSTVGPEFARIALRASDDRLRQALQAGLVAMPEPAGQPARRARRLAVLLTGPDYEQVISFGPGYADEALALGDRLPALNALEEAAVAAAATGRKDTARVLARRAAGLAADTGAIAVGARLSGRLRNLGVRLGSTAPRARPRFGWESLTDTERRIVDLVAAGIGGPDIARQLHLSPRTVQTHVSHALAKLGLSNRVELAAAAARCAVSA